MFMIVIVLLPKLSAFTAEFDDFGCYNLFVIGIASLTFHTADFILELLIGIVCKTCCSQPILAFKKAMNVFKIVYCIMFFTGVICATVVVNLGTTKDCVVQSR
jgi:multisubunit Na+/H+ antiporter MnhE subunit